MVVVQKCVMVFVFVVVGTQDGITIPTINKAIMRLISMAVLRHRVLRIREARLINNIPNIKRTLNFPTDHQVESMRMNIILIMDMVLLIHRPMSMQIRMVCSLVFHRVVALYEYVYV